MSGSEVVKTRRQVLEGFTCGVLGGAAALAVMSVGVANSGIICTLTSMPDAVRADRINWWRKELETKVTALVGKKEYSFEHRLVDQLVSDVKKDGFHCSFDYGTLTGARTNWESRLDEVHWAFCQDGYRSAYHPVWSAEREKTMAA